MTTNGINGLVAQMNSIFAGVIPTFARSPIRANRTTNLNDIVLQLQTQNYQFTKNDFDNFMIYYGSNYHYCGDEMLSAFLALHFPTPIQIDNLLKLSRFGGYCWLNTLLNRNYALTTKQLAKIRKTHYYHDKVYDTDKKLTSKLNEVINDGRNTTTQIINFIDKCKHRLKYDLSYNFAKASKETIARIYEHIIAKEPQHITEMHDIILKHKLYDLHFNVTMIQAGLKLTPELMKLYAKNKYDSIELMKMCVLENIVPDVDIMNNVLKSHYNNVISMFDKYRYFIDLNIAPNQSTFDIICYKHSIEIFNDLVMNYNFIPNESSLTHALEGYGEICGNYDFIEKILSNKINITNEHYEKAAKIKHNDLIDLFHKYGYRTSLADIKLRIISRLEITENEINNIDFDDEVYFLSYMFERLSLWIAHTDKFKLEATQIQFHLFCEKRSLNKQTFLNYINKNNVKLDRYALETLAKRSPRLVIEIILKTKIEPSIGLFYHINRLVFDDESYFEFAKKYNINHDYMKYQYDIDWSLLKNEHDTNDSE